MKNVATKKPKLVRKREDGLVGIREFRENVKTYEKKVKTGETFTVLRHSTPIFRVVPPQEENLEDVIDFTEISKEGVSAEDIYNALRALKSK